MTLKGYFKYLLYTKVPWAAGAYPYFGSTVYFPTNSFLFKLLCDQGIFENQTLQAISKLARPQTYIFDVGANIGLISVPLLKLCSNCIIISFEPSPSTLTYLYKTRDGSPYSDRWQIIPKAVSSEISTSNFSVHGNGMSAFDGLISTGRQPDVANVTVEVTTLDSEWNALGRPPVSVIKCDVEGAELSVLRGAKQCIESQHPVIFLEWNCENFKSYENDHGDLLKFAEQHDYMVLLANSASMVTSSKQIKVANSLDLENFILLPRKGCSQ